MVGKTLGPYKMLEPLGAGGMGEVYRDPLALLFVALATLLCACTGPAEPGANILAIRDVTVIAANGDPPLERATVVVAGERILAVGESEEIEVPGGASEVDGSGKFLIPGLWDMHAHLSKARGSALGLFVVYGVTGVRDMGGDHEELLRWRGEIEAGERVGPRIRLAGPYLESADNVQRMRSTPPGEMIEPVERTRIPVGSPGEARRVVGELATRELDFLKIRTFQDRDTYLAIAGAAQDAGLDLVGHVFGLTPEDILEAGQRGIDHFFYPTLDDRSPEERAEAFEGLADAGVRVVPTLVTYTESALLPDDVVAAVLDDEGGVVGSHRNYLSRYLVDDWREQVLERDPELLPLFRQIYASTVRDLREMHAGGVSIMPGTDVAVVMIFPGSSVHDEMELFVTELGMTPMEVIERATRHPAEFLGLGDSLGTIEPGKLADLVLLDADPLTDILNVRRISAVVLRGRYLDREALDGLLARVESAEDRRVNDWPRTPRPDVR